MRRIRRSFRLRRGPLPFRYVLIISFFIFLILTVQGLWLVNKSIEPTLMSYAEVQTKRLATVIITKAVEDQVSEGLNTEKLVKVEKDSDGNVASVDVDAQMVSSIVTSTTTTMEKYLHEAEKGNVEKLGIKGTAKVNLAKSLADEGILFTVPLGQVTKNAILGNIGPKIPVSFTTIGDVSAKVKEQVKPYGINNVMVQVVMEVEVMLKVIIPFETKETKVKTNIPLMIKIIQGDVPSYYHNGGANGASPALPSVKEKNS